MPFPSRFPQGTIIFLAPEGALKIPGAIRMDSAREMLLAIYS